MQIRLIFSMLLALFSVERGCRDAVANEAGETAMNQRNMKREKWIPDENYEGWIVWYVGRTADGAAVYGSLRPDAPMRKEAIGVLLWKEGRITEFRGTRVRELLDGLAERVEIPPAVQAAADRYVGGCFQPLEYLGDAPNGAEIYVVKTPEGSLTGLPILFTWLNGRVGEVSGTEALELLRTLAAD